MIRRSPLGVLLQVASLASIVVIFVVPEQWRWWALVASVLLIAANTGHVLWGFRQERRRAAAVVAAHPNQTALTTTLFDLDGTSRSERSRVVAVIADRGGLSFRDGSDAEIAQVAGGRVLSIELAPLEPRSGARPAVVTLIDGSPVKFWVGAKPDDQAEAVVALREALGRSA